jgi:hypothetical protein
VWDITPLRAMVGAGLLVCFSSASLAVARRRINVMLMGGTLAGVDRALAEGVCRECGYAAHGPATCCPECGRTLAPERLVAFIWPRVLGTPTRARRVRLRIGLIAAAVGLLAAPLLGGIVRVLVGAM